MSRVTRTKLLLLLLIVLVPVATASIIMASDFNPLVIVGVPAACFVLAGMQRRVIRGLYRGSRLLNTGQPAAALAVFQRLRDQLQEEPWRRRWFVLTSFYTPSPDALLLHNVGTAHMHLGNLVEAERYFAEALATDPLYPLPHYNRAVLAAVLGDRDTAEAHLAEALRLSYTGGTVDRVIRQAQLIAARLCGRGESAG